jgi:hypothetical protein
MAPILILYKAPMRDAEKAAVVLLSLFAFAVSLSSFKDSKPQDIFFGTATYVYFQTWLAIVRKC